MAFDFKKEYKEFYMPKSVPSIVEIPEMKYIAVAGEGNPNEVDGAYQKALGILYPVAYTLKMSYKTDYRMEGFFEYVVPPLEGLWWMDNEDGDFSDKTGFRWIAMIRVPDFVTEKDVEWAKQEVMRKKGLNCDSIYFMSLEEGLCAQIMHVGPYDDEPKSLEILDTYLNTERYVKDLTEKRRHHEIYLSDPRKTAPEKLKTVLRIPVTKI